MQTLKRTESSARTIFRVTSGNFLEMYDFSVYGFYAVSIAHALFPRGNEFVSLMLSLATFGVGFLMRPIGALVLGAYIDRKGRRKGLLLTLGLMSVGMLMITFVPGYQTIGIAAPIIVVLGRLLQGFSAGAELGGTRIGQRRHGEHGALTQVGGPLGDRKALDVRLGAPTCVRPRASTRPCSNTGPTRCPMCQLRIFASSSPA